MKETHPQNFRNVNASRMEPNAGRHSPTEFGLKQTATIAGIVKSSRRTQ